MRLTSLYNTKYVYFLPSTIGIEPRKSLGSSGETQEKGTSQLTQYGIHLGEYYNTPKQALIVGC